MTILSIAGPTEQEESIHETKEQTLRAEFAKRIALGGGWSIGAAIVLGAYDLLRSNPRDAFPLLMTWGPKAVGTIIIVYVVYDLAKMALNLVSRLVHSVEKLAVAQQKSADKDDRQIQEMQTLTSYSAQQSERTHQMVAGVIQSLGEVNRKLDEMKDDSRGQR